MSADDHASTAVPRDDVRRLEQRRLLLDLRRQLGPEMHRKLRLLRQGAPAAPVADEAPRESSAPDVEAALAERDAETLARIDEALRGLDRGTYGVCAHCGGDIPLSRLRALPFALRCVACQESEEQGSALRTGPRPLYPDDCEAA
jgi:DnaK suppressor protein